MHHYITYYEIINNNIINNNNSNNSNNTTSAALILEHVLTAGKFRSSICMLSFRGKCFNLFQQSVFSVAHTVSRLICFVEIM